MGGGNERSVEFIDKAMGFEDKINIAGPFWMKIMPDRLNHRGFDDLSLEQGR